MPCPKLARLGVNQDRIPEHIEGCRMTIDIVYDNYLSDPRCQTGWGYACLIRGFEKTILFDTGGDGAMLLANMAVLGIDPNEVEVVVVSHRHGDHAGGLEALLERNSHLTVFTLRSFPDDIKDKVRSTGARATEVQDPIEICPGIHSLGEMGTQMKEQSLYLETPAGLVLITGCAHPGIVEIVERAREVAQEPVRFLVGGQHLKGLPEQKLQSLMSSLRRLGVDKMAPSHCTGDKARRLAEEMLGDRYVAAGVGARLVLDTEPEEVQ